MFLASEISENSYNSSKTVILPIPYEKTTSYIKGTEKGPQAIIEASSELEAYDSELETEILKTGIYTAPEPDDIYKSAKKYLYDKKFLVSLGGEHTISAPLFKAAQENKELGLIHLDAHFDLRDTYQGTKNSHATVLRRIREHTDKTLSLGIRSFSKEEADHAKKHKIDYVTDKNISKFSLEKLPKDIYLTIDLDFFSPAEIPGVGTPVPGGPSWWEGMQIIRKIFQQKNILAMDVVELCPAVESIRSPFAAAMLVYKCIGYKFS